MAFNATKALSECLGVTVLASGTDLVQPRTGFQVASVHSILDVAAKVRSLEQACLVGAVLQNLVPKLVCTFISGEQSEMVKR